MAAGLDQALTEWWAATDNLTALIPPELVSTEIRQTIEDIVDDEDGDYLWDDCVTYEISTETDWRTNCGQGYASTVNLSCHSMQYDQAKQVIQAVITAWERQTFTGAGCKITACLTADEVEAEQDDETGVWTVSQLMTIKHTTV